QYHRRNGSRRADWAALWAAWVARNHEAVMRQAKAGLGAPTAPTAQPGPAAPIEHAGAKRHETARSAELHDALREMLGRDLWAAWIEPAALLFHDDGLRVVATSAFRRDQIEDRHLAAIRDALSVIGAGVDWVKVESEPAGKRGRQAA
ncbi:MAG TPA: DnaA N-terminal domain-containing protein, partial [Novosphingobium sp.]|nr:DnaA N-terminal domain-containing protein [Novosphingobium sp.]